MVQRWKDICGKFSPEFEKRILFPDDNNNSLIFLSPSYIKKLNAKLFKIC